jgi:purine-nucleoside phosphorylase
MKSKEAVQQYESRIREAAEHIRSAWDKKPEFMMILGSGLGPLAEAVKNPVVLSYTDIPGFPRVSVPGHSGRLILGSWHDRSVAVMQGRFHYYEGHDMADIVFPVRVMQALKVRRLIVTNAAGGINPGMKPGDLMLIRDHIGLFAPSPLFGVNLDAFGPRFPDQSHVYHPDWLETGRRCAKKLDLLVHTGVYAWCRGPQFETPAEIRALERLGADAVGMSTVPEVIAASHGIMSILGLSLISNMAAGISPRPLTHDEVIAVGKQASGGAIRLLSAMIEAIEPEGDLNHDV